MRMRTLLQRSFYVQVSRPARQALVLAVLFGCHAAVAQEQAVTPRTLIELDNTRPAEARWQIDGRAQEPVKRFGVGVAEVEPGAREVRVDVADGFTRTFTLDVKPGDHMIVPLDPYSSDYRPSPLLPLNLCPSPCQYSRSRYAAMPQGNQTADPNEGTIRYRKEMENWMLVRIMHLVCLKRILMKRDTT